MASTQPYRIKTLHEFHQLRGLPPPAHPLVSVVDYGAVRHSTKDNTTSWVFDFYSISIKRNPSAKIRYGQQSYDFDGGVLFFMAPCQVLRVEVEEHSKEPHSGWILLIHPDFLWKTPLAQRIRQYAYFDYSVNEALFLSEKEEATLQGIIEHIRQESHSNLDAFSQDIIIAQLELLLTYGERFYQRQFFTRKISSHQLLDRLEELLAHHFQEDGTISQGLPTVQSIADALHVSPSYLSSLLKVLTGQSTQQHIHDRLIAKAKEKLSTTDLTVSEIAYALGFEHPQSFSKLFKTKTKLSPLEFRQSFN